MKIIYRKAAKRAPARPRPRAGLTTPAAPLGEGEDELPDEVPELPLLWVEDGEPSPDVVPPVVALPVVMVVRPLRVKVPFVPDAIAPVPAATPVPIAPTPVPTAVTI